MHAHARTYGCTQGRARHGTALAGKWRYARRNVNACRLVPKYLSIRPEHLKNTCMHTSRGRGDQCILRMHVVVCRVRVIDRHCGRSPCRLMTDRCIPPSNSALRRRRQRLLYCAWFSIYPCCRRSSSWEWHIFCCSVVDEGIGEEQ